MARLPSLVLVMLLAVGACGESAAPAHDDRDRGGALPPPVAARVLIDRNWIDRLPRSEHDRLHVFRFTPAMGGGVYQDRTLFAGKFELFLFAVKGDGILFDLPHTGERVRTPYTIRKIEGRGPLDLELRLAHSPRGPSVYYGSSREGHSEADVGLWLSKLVPELARAARPQQ